MAINLDQNYVYALVSRGALRSELKEMVNPYQDLQKVLKLI